MSPTFDAHESRFQRDLRGLTSDQRAAFRAAIGEFVEDLKKGDQPRPSLRVKRVVAAPGVWEITWAADGRATFEYGREVRPGEPHVIWRRVGTHKIFDRP